MARRPARTICPGGSRGDLSVPHDHRREADARSAWLGSDDGIAVWLNGRLLSQGRPARRLPDQDNVQLALRRARTSCC